MARVKYFNEVTGQWEYADAGGLSLPIADARYLKTDEMGIANGVATLGSDGKVPETQLPSIDVSGQINGHNTAPEAHNDIRELLRDLSTKINNFLDVDDETSDQLSEVLTLIENNKGTLESLTTGKINVSDIIDNLTTNSSDKVLSAAQGVALKALIDAIQIPTTLPASDVYDWAKAESKPSYTKSEVELGNVDNVKQYSAENPPPYPVTSVNGKSGAVSLTASDVGAEAAGSAAANVTTNLNRSTAVNVADENYTTYMARGESLNATETTAPVNGTIAWTYE